MKYAHLADIHIGGWREPKLKDASTKAFVKAVDTCIEQEVNFILIAGDLFNSSHPSIDNLRIVVKKLRQLKNNSINVYIVPGSHDFSSSGRTILDVLEEAALLHNVCKGEVINNKLKLNFAVDKKTGAFITGMIGRKGALEKKYYETLIKENLEQQEGYKIFLFHTAITELKPKDLEKMDSSPLSFLPKNFNYYAGGHPHYVFKRKEEGFGLIAYPGALFPNNFKELEQFGRGGFYIIDNDNIEHYPIQIHNTYSINLDCNHKSAKQAETLLLNEIKEKEFYNTIVTIRISGILEQGKPSDINFKEIFDTLYSKGAHFVMKNTNKLNSKEFEEIQVKADSAEEIEESIIGEHLQQIKVNGLDTEKEKALTNSLLNSLNIERKEGERVTDFEERLVKEVNKILEQEKLV
ncbi:DNA repair exonuclease [Candidatus Woesearchaeota archaeon]|nr:DNA repair exonuclease [Candidatus Woesearchaeota archaeon]